MVQGKVKQDLTKELILSHLSEEQIMEYYLGHAVEDDGRYLSPFRKEDSPSFSIKRLESGLHYKDFGDDSYSGGCVDLVMQLFNISFYEALKKISNDFNLGPSILDNRKEYQRVLNDRAERPPKKRKIIQVITRPLTKIDKAYWASYDISTEELRRYNIYSIKKYLIDEGQSNPPWWIVGADELCFGYFTGEKWKIYRPLSEDKERKWFTNISNRYIWDIDIIVPGTKRCFITKSRKDQIILSKFLSPVVSVQSESSGSISEEGLSLLKSNCEEVYIIFDNDTPGVKASTYFSENHGFRWINCPKGYIDNLGKPIKDFADLARHYGLETVINYFKSKNLM